MSFKYVYDFQTNVHEFEQKNSWISKKNLEFELFSFTNVCDFMILNFLMNFEKSVKVFEKYSLFWKCSQSQNIYLK